MDALPEYEQSTLRMVERQRLATGFARQLALTTAPRMDIPFEQCRVVDIGCGYGHTAAELARLCDNVVGIEPNGPLADHARGLAEDVPNFEFRRQSIGEFTDVEQFDVAVLDNVLEHLDDQPDALRRISRCLRPGGVAFILVPNRLWPIEAHYALPFLSYLPVPLANRYLRLTRRGHDYTDASYAPTYWRLRALLRDCPDLDARFTLPGDVSLAEGGASPLYSMGVKALRRWPALWAISKSLLVVAKKTPPRP